MKFVPASNYECGLNEEKITHYVEHPVLIQPHHESTVEGKRKTKRGGEERRSRKAEKRSKPEAQRSEAEKEAKKRRRVEKQKEEKKRRRVEKDKRSEKNC